MLCHGRRIGARWALWLLLAPAINSFGGEDIVEFPWYIYSQTVTTSPAESTVTLNNLLCEPDPYQDICASVSKDEMRSAEDREARMRSFMDQLVLIRERVYREAVKDLGPVPSASSPTFTEYKTRFFKKINEDFEDPKNTLEKRFQQNFEKTRGEVQANISFVRGLMQEALSHSNRFAAERAVLNRFLNCSLRVNLVWDDLTQNAAIGTVAWDAQALMSMVRRIVYNGNNLILSETRAVRSASNDRDESVVVNPLLEGVSARCALDLTPKTWLACSGEATSGCVWLLLHEFGHLLNSCKFYSLESELNRLLFEARSGSTLQDKAESAAYRFAGEQARALARKIAASSACLEPLASSDKPQYPVLNSCPDSDPFVSAEYDQRCGISQVKGYEGQWREAEADFFSASGLAIWLAQKSHDRESRMKIVYGVLAEHCANKQVEAARHEDYAKDVLAIVEKLNQKPVRQPATSHPKPGCADTPRNDPRENPWRDAHQLWSVRMNRNILRNSDLRRALGCPNSDPHIPVACSPLF